MKVIPKHEITWIQPYYDILLNMIPQDVKTVLDVGTGYGVFGFIIKNARSCHITGIEPFQGYDLSHYDEVIRKPFDEYEDMFDRKFDCIVCTEVIEHMEKHLAMKFLSMIKSLGKTVIIATPFNDDSQDSFDGNPYQVHQCRISPEEFRQEGYDVSFIGSMNFPPRPKIVKRIYHSKLNGTLKGMGVKPRDSLAIRVHYKNKLSLFHKMLNVKPTNTIGVYNES